MTLAAACAAIGISRQQGHRMAKDGRLSDLLRGRDRAGRLLIETGGNLREFERVVRGRMRIRIDSEPCRRELAEKAGGEPLAHHPLELIEWPGDQEEVEQREREEQEARDRCRWFWEEWGRWAPDEELTEEQAWGHAVDMAVHLVWGDDPPPELSPGNVEQLLSALEQTQADVALGARFDLERYLAADAVLLITEAEDGCVESGLQLQDKLNRNRVPQQLVARAQGALLALDRMVEDEDEREEEED